MSDQVLKNVPISATMRRQSDGSYKMVDAAYADVPVSVFIELLLRKMPRDIRREPTAG